MNPDQQRVSVRPLSSFAGQLRPSVTSNESTVSSLQTQTVHSRPIVGLRPLSSHPEHITPRNRIKPTSAVGRRHGRLRTMGITSVELNALGDNRSVLSKSLNTLKDELSVMRLPKETIGPLEIEVPASDSFPTDLMSSSPSPSLLRPLSPQPATSRPHSSNARVLLKQYLEDVKDLERTSKVSFANSKPENLRASCGLPQTSLDALQNAYAREMDSFDSVALFVETRYLEMINFEGEGRDPSKFKAALAADLLMKLTDAMGRYAPIARPLIWELCNCIFLDYPSAEARFRHDPKQLMLKELVRTPTYLEQAHQLQDRLEEMASEADIASRGLQMKVFVKKFQTLRLAFRDADVFARDACFRLWRGYWRKSRHLSRLATLKYLRIRFKQWRAFTSSDGGQLRQREKLSKDLDKKIKRLLTLNHNLLHLSSEGGANANNEDANSDGNNQLQQSQILADLLADSGSRPGSSQAPMRSLEVERGGSFDANGLVAEDSGSGEGSPMLPLNSQQPQQREESIVRKEPNKLRFAAETFLGKKIKVDDPSSGHASDSESHRRSSISQVVGTATLVDNLAAQVIMKRQQQYRPNSGNNRPNRRRVAQQDAAVQANEADFQSVDVNSHTLLLARQPQGKANTVDVDDYDHDTYMIICLSPRDQRKQHVANVTTTTRHMHGRRTSMTASGTATSHSTVLHNGADPGIYVSTELSMDFVTQLIGHIYEALFCHYHYELVSSPSASGSTKHSITITNSNGEVTSLLFFARDVLYRRYHYDKALSRGIFKDFLRGCLEYVALSKRIEVFCHLTGLLTPEMLYENYGDDYGKMPSWIPTQHRQQPSPQHTKSKGDILTVPVPAVASEDAKTYQNNGKHGNESVNEAHTTNATTTSSTTTAALALADEAASITKIKVNQEMIASMHLAEKLQCFVLMLALWTNNQPFAAVNLLLTGMIDRDLVLFHLPTLFPNLEKENAVYEQLVTQVIDMPFYHAHSLKLGNSLDVDKVDLDVVCDLLLRYEALEREAKSKISNYLQDFTLDDYF